MPNYCYVSKKCRSLVRELSLNPFSPFTILEIIIGFRACCNLAMVFYFSLVKKSGTRMIWILIRDRLNVFADYFVNLRNLPYYE